MAKARDIPGLDGDEPFGDGGGGASSRVRAAGAVGAGRPTSSTRATSSACTTCASPRAGCARCSRSSRRASRRRSTRDVLRDVKRLADALGERRDPDVHIDALSGFEAAAPASARAGIESLLGSLRERAGARATGRSSRRCARRTARDLRTRLAELVASAGEGAGVKARKVKGLDRDGTLADNVERIVRVRLDELLRLHAEARSTRRGRGAARHADRGQAAALHPRADRRPASAPTRRPRPSRRKALQDLLGEIHDCDVMLPLGARPTSERRRARTTPRSCARWPATRGGPGARARGPGAAARRPIEGWCCSSCTCARGATCSIAASSSAGGELERDGLRERAGVRGRRAVRLPGRDRRPGAAIGAVATMEAAAVTYEHDTAVAAPEDARPLRQPALYFNRELSWLDFNDRVLQLAEDAGRCRCSSGSKFCAIYTSNLDEFFMVRVAGLHDQVDAGIDARGADGRTPKETLDGDPRAGASSSGARLHAHASPGRCARARRARHPHRAHRRRRRRGARGAGRALPPPDLPGADAARGRARAARSPTSPTSRSASRCCCATRSPRTTTFARVKVPKEMLPRFVQVAEAERTFVPLEEVIAAQPRRAVPGHGDPRLRLLPRHARRRLHGLRRGRRPARGGRGRAAPPPLRRGRAPRGRHGHEPADARAARRGARARGATRSSRSTGCSTSPTCGRS